MEEKDGGPPEKPKAQTIICIDASKRETHHAGNGFKKLFRRLRSSNYKPISNKEDLTPQLLGTADVLAVGAPPRAFTADELRDVKEFVANGGSLLVLSSEGGEPKLGCNVNELLEGYGMSAQPDSVLRTVYYKYLHPKEVFVSHGVLQPELATHKHLSHGNARKHRAAAPRRSRRALREPPSPPLDQFDLDEHFASKRERLAQLTNKCIPGGMTKKDGDAALAEPDDLEYYVREAGEIVGATAHLAARSPENALSAKHVLAFVLNELVTFKKHRSAGTIIASTEPIKKRAQLTHLSAYDADAKDAGPAPLDDPKGGRLAPAALAAGPGARPTASPRSGGWSGNLRPNAEKPDAPGGGGGSSPGRRLMGTQQPSSSVELQDSRRFFAGGARGASAGREPSWRGGATSGDAAARSSSRFDASSAEQAPVQCAELQRKGRRGSSFVARPPCGS
ncbi:intraflagellar transport-like protein [Aureococcus anophagefferens]|uniref:Intraflagellar transport-like protein n=1 Tax=Aureococcus anophagefferens TaxID=44056 RepID=A0ABR1G9C0_AURAN